MKPRGADAKPRERRLTSPRDRRLAALEARADVNAFDLDEYRQANYSRRSAELGIPEYHPSLEEQIELRDLTRRHPIASLYLHGANDE